MYCVHWTFNNIIKIIHVRFLRFYDFHARSRYIITCLTVCYVCRIVNTKKLTACFSYLLYNNKKYIYLLNFLFDHSLLLIDFFSIFWFSYSILIHLSARFVLKIRVFKRSYLCKAAIDDLLKTIFRRFQVILAARHNTHSIITIF